MSSPTTIKTASQSNIVFKIIIVGDAGSGKSCLLMKYTKNDSNQDYNPTIGVEFQSKLVQIDDNQLKLQIWDTAGQESFRSIVRSFYRNSSSVFLVYNIADRKSFESLQIWYEEAKTNALEDAVFVLVGAQRDREADRQVSYDEGVEFMKKKGFHLFFETSAVSGDNVENAFNEAAKLVYRNHQMEKQKQLDSIIQSQNIQNPDKSLQPNQNGKQIDKTVNLKISNAQDAQKKGCC